MRTISAALAIALTLIGSPAAAEPRHRCDPAPTRPTTLPELDPTALAALIGQAPDGQVSGMTVSIRGTAGCWRGADGIAEIGSGRPVPVDGRFRIGSMTKPFVAVTALQLAAEGRLNLDRTVQRYLPGLLPASYPPITVRQVLTYTSGLNLVDVPHKTPAWFFEHRYDTWEPRSQLDVTKALAFRPGEKQRYGNADYIVAGLLIEKVTGRTWQQEVTRRIIRPLRLHATEAPSTERRIHGPHAHGYEAMPDGTWVDVTEANPSLQWSAAAMISNAADLDRFLAAVLDGRLLPAEEEALMFTVPPVPAYDGDADPANDKPAVNSAGLTYVGQGVWGKTGDRPGYTVGMGGTRDGARRLVYAANTLRMGGPLPRLARELQAAVYQG